MWLMIVINYLTSNQCSSSKASVPAVARTVILEVNTAWSVAWVVTGERIVRHNAVQDALHSMAAAAGHPPNEEAAAQLNCTI